MAERERSAIPESDFSIDFNDTTSEPMFCLNCGGGPLHESWWMSGPRGPYCSKCIKRKTGNA